MTPTRRPTSSTLTELLAAHASVPRRALAPAEATVRRAAKDEGCSSHLATGEGWTLRAVRYRGGSAVVTVTATTAEMAQTVIEESTKDVQEPEEAPKDAVDIAFTYLTAHGPRRAIRNITTTPWTDLRPNYAGAVQGRFDDLMKLTPDNLEGRLLLLHGPLTALLAARASAPRRHRQDDRPAQPGAGVAAVVQDRLHHRPGGAVQQSGVPDEHGGCSRRAVTS